MATNEQQAGPIAGSPGERAPDLPPPPLGDAPLAEWRLHPAWVIVDRLQSVAGMAVLVLGTPVLGAVAWDHAVLKHKAEGGPVWWFAVEAAVLPLLGAAVLLGLGLHPWRCARRCTVYAHGVVITPVLGRERIVLPREITRVELPRHGSSVIRLCDRRWAVYVEANARTRDIRRLGAALEEVGVPVSWR